MQCICIQIVVSIKGDSYVNQEDKSKQKLDGYPLS